LGFPNSVAFLPKSIGLALVKSALASIAVWSSVTRTALLHKRGSSRKAEGVLQNREIATNAKQGSHYSLFALLVLRKRAASVLAKPNGWAKIDISGWDRFEHENEQKIKRDHAQMSESEQAKERSS
jgi:hypothetical protein